MTYLVPFDFTTTARNALNYALFLSEGTDTKVLLMHIVKSANEVTAAENQLNEVATALPASDRTRVEQKVIVGNISEDIAKVAALVEAELVVMGTHGRTGLLRLLMGSVAEAVVRRSKCAVLTVKPANDDEGD